LGCSSGTLITGHLLRPPSGCTSGSRSAPEGPHTYRYVVVRPSTTAGTGSASLDAALSFLPSVVGHGDDPALDRAAAAAARAAPLRSPARGEQPAAWVR